MSNRFFVRPNSAGRDSNAESACTRRQIIRNTSYALAGLGVVATLPPHWKKPLVDAVVLPAHAQTSFAVSFSSARLTSATSENRPLSGGGSASDALATLGLSGCAGVPGETVTCDFLADLGGTLVPIGMNSAVTDAAGSFTVTVNVPTTTVVSTGAITQIIASCEALGVSSTIPLTPAQLSPALAGAAPTPAACAI